MIIKLKIRTAPDSHSRCTMGVDYKLEDSDSVRVNNLGLDIVAALKGIVSKSQERGEVKL